MKKIIIYSLYLFTALTIFTACRKDDNPKLPGLTRVPVPVMIVDAANSDQFISPASPATFKVKFGVEKLFDNDINPQEVDVVVMKNSNTGNVKVFKSNIALPSTVQITGQDLINLFGPIVGADKFDIGLDLTLPDGRKLAAFPALGTSYASGLISEIGNVKPGAATSLTYLMPCPFVSSAYNGDFVVVSDEWQDYLPGDVITVTSINATQISFKYNVDAGSAQPIVMTINPADNSISVAPQFYGTYGGTPVWATSVPGAASQVNPCDLSLSLRLKHTDPSGSTTYALATIKLRKQ